MAHLNVKVGTANAGHLNTYVIIHHRKDIASARYDHSSDIERQGEASIFVGDIMTTMCDRSISFFELSNKFTYTLMMRQSINERISLPCSVA